MLKEKKFTHLSHEEREKLTIFNALKFSKRRMAKELNRSTSTITREFKRGYINKGQYYALRTQIHINKRKKARRIRKTDDSIVKEYIIEKLEPPFHWSPEIISVKIKEELGISIGKDSIYTFVYEHRELTKYLTRKHIRKKPGNKNNKKNKTLIPNRTDIDERPTEANERKELGHMEIDCIESKIGSKTALIVMTDRTARKTTIKKLTRKTAEQVSSSIIFAFKEYNIFKVKTITYDNGLEFCRHELVNKELGSKSYFCKPYHAWEKGTIENINGMIRRFFPKKTDFDTITDEEIQYVENWINNRPMKILSYKSPNQKFDELLKNMSVAF